MKTIGMIGGLGPESTIDYYKIINSRIRSMTGHNPHIVIDSIDIYGMLEYVKSKNYSSLVNLLLNSATNLKNAGADVAFIASNTPHIVFDAVASKTDLKLISIVESTCKSIKLRNYKRVLLTGTMFTMTENFYSSVAKKYGFDIVVPSKEEINQIHDIIFPELEEGIIVPEKRNKFISIIDVVKNRESIDAVILGCTELPIMIKPEDLSIDTVNTVECHIDSILEDVLV